jgi:pimeloyl-ACP methyl ester carboxylesterase
MPFAENEGLKIHYDTLGNGPPLIMVPGLAATNIVWKLNGYQNALRDHFTLIPTKPRGFGKSSKPHNSEAYHYRNIASDIVSVIDDLGYEKVHYLGYSMGAEMGFGLLKYAENRFNSFILGGGNPSDEALNLSRSSWKTGFQRGVDFFIEAAEPRFGEYWSNDLEAMFRSNDAEALIAYNSVELDEKFCEIFPRISVPCMIYSGDLDDWMDGVEEMVASIPQHRYVVLEGGLDHFGGYFGARELKPHLIQFMKDYDFL